jgi:hypothetical protein
VSDQDKPSPTSPGSDEPADIGSVGEEAAKLLGAFSEWARDQGSDVGTGLGGLASQAAASMAGINEHLATGSAECTYCPICRTVHAIRETSPEVRAHLATAASSFLQAAAQLMATQVPNDSGRATNVERIDLDEDPGPGPGEA